MQQQVQQDDVSVKRLTVADVELARRLFAEMAAVFEEECAPLSDRYLAGLLARDDFWALAAIEGDGRVAGGLTAHTLPATRSEGAEVFLYDLAVAARCQRRGIGRRLVNRLREDAAANGIAVMFVAADNEDTHALDFYRAVGGVASPVTVFTYGG